MTRAFLAFAVLLAAVPAAGERVCADDQNTEAALRRLLAALPEKTTSAFVAEAWPVDLPWGTSDGTLSTFSHFAYVVDDECLCCDSFTFENQDGTDRLTTISLFRLQKSRRSAVVVARKLTALVSRESTQEQELPFTTNTEIAPGVVQTTRTTVGRVPGGWRIHLLVSRVGSE
jgi:hypothetical protein